MPDRLDIVATKDGSSTIYSSRFDAHYHSIHGAVQESEYVFIKQGLEYWRQSQHHREISVLEYGMGTGLNVALTHQYVKRHDLNVRYHTLEAYPISDDISQLISYKGLSSLEAIHQASWDQVAVIGDHLMLHKHQVEFEQYTSDQRFDVIYYDAFGPGAQPHLWERPMVEKVVSMIAGNGVLVTYCAQGAFRRILIDMGLLVERLQGPPGKRHMVRAQKKS